MGKLLGDAQKYFGRSYNVTIVRFESEIRHGVPFAFQNRLGQADSNNIEHSLFELNVCITKLTTSWQYSTPASQTACELRRPTGILFIKVSWSAMHFYLHSFIAHIYLTIFVHYLYNSMWYWWGRGTEQIRSGICNKNIKIVNKW